MKAIKRIEKRWDAATPRLAKVAQFVISVVVVSAENWKNLPTEWVASIPAEWTRVMPIAAFFAIAALQLTKRKDTTNE